LRDRVALRRHSDPPARPDWPFAGFKQQEEELDPDESCVGTPSGAFLCTKRPKPCTGYPCDIGLTLA
jgi:hypothetical protein